MTVQYALSFIVPENITWEFAKVLGRIVPPQLRPSSGAHITLLPPWYSGDQEWLQALIAVLGEWKPFPIRLGRAQMLEQNEAMQRNTSSIYLPVLDPETTALHNRLLEAMLPFVPELANNLYVGEAHLSRVTIARTRDPRRSPMAKIQEVAHQLPVLCFQATEATLLMRTEKNPFQPEATIALSVR